MQRYQIKVEYDGTNFVGWQYQKNGLSIQEILQKAIFQFSREKVTVTGAGRTDAGVHAVGQIAHFDLKKKHKKKKFFTWCQPIYWKKSCNYFKHKKNSQ